ncbi:aspartate kinase [Vibrio tapetis]|uniref:Aspartokinase n=1 Tax=Vibrio tapetis subsp. tapetis TaxID=1671868 RepID=A0A2N8Z844_9VIBR|nr:aspartate kinase [Vibrio tapetis]SON48084.1 Aspartokinase [Vibrio tapetis subsp. tapetis]
MTRTTRDSLIVQKFGGTSVGSIERIEAVAQRVIKAKSEGNQLVVVVSAMSGETNRLMDLALQVDAVPTARELDVLLSAGEQVTMALLAMTLNKMGTPAVSMTGFQAGIQTNDQHNNASIKHIDTQLIESYLEQEQVVIVAGFQGITDDGNISTLGRGGSDTTAVALAGALRASECQIFTDVDGVYTCDPRVVPSATKLATIDFPSMEEMARKGAKVLHLPSVQHAWKQRVPLRVLSSFSHDTGTLVCGEKGDNQICGLAMQQDLILVQVVPAELHSLINQCQLLGIEVWDVLKTENYQGVIIKQNQFAKLALVLSDKICASKNVSALTCVGDAAPERLNAIHSLLKKHNVDVFWSMKTKNSVMLLICPEQLEVAANLVHNSFVVTNIELDGHQVLMVS